MGQAWPRVLTCLEELILFKSLRHEFDPLDREILERAFDATWAAVKGNDRSNVNIDSDEGLEAILRCETDRDGLLKRFKRPRGLARHPLDSSIPGQTSVVNRASRCTRLP